MYIPLIFLLTAFFLGFSISINLSSRFEMPGENSGFFLTLALAFPAGAVVLGDISYFSSYFSKIYLKNVENCQSSGIAVGVIASLFISFFLLFLNKKMGKNGMRIYNGRKAAGEAVFFAVLFSFIFFSFFYVFHVKNGVLYSGASVYSDYSPHTAMIRSFSKNNNFPTQYPHYGGADVRYHFLFQYFIGVLERLGMRIDTAYNLCSALGLSSFLIFLYFLSLKLAKSSAAGVIAIVMFFFRSGSAIFIYLFKNKENLGKAIKNLRTHSDFIGYTLHEDWGFWNYNVFLNQRHLGFALSIAAAVIFVFSDFVKEREKDAWNIQAFKTSDIKTSLLLGILLGLLGFYNGAVVIGCLLILFGFFLFSSEKLDFVITAGISVMLCFLQSGFFIKSGGFKPKFQFGFIGGDTAGDVLTYIFRLSGLYFVVLIVLLMSLKGKNKKILLSFMAPYIFAFCVNMTGDVAVNHKYIIMATLFSNIYVAYSIAALWREKNAVLRIFASVLLVSLTLTGAYDMRTIFVKNESKAAVNLNSELTRWLCKNTTENDLFLTPQYSMSEFTMSGDMMYLGWPYYPASAGYDTDRRQEIVDMLYTTDDAELFRKTAKEEGIDYVVYEKDMKTASDTKATEKLIKKICKKVFEDGETAIYLVPN